MTEEKVTSNMAIDDGTDREYVPCDKITKETPKEEEESLMEAQYAFEVAQLELDRERYALDRERFELDRLMFDQNQDASKTPVNSQVDPDQQAFDAAVLAHDKDRLAFDKKNYELTTSQMELSRERLMFAKEKLAADTVLANKNSIEAKRELYGKILAEDSITALIKVLNSCTETRAQHVKDMAQAQLDLSNHTQQLPILNNQRKDAEMFAVLSVTGKVAALPDGTEVAVANAEQRSAYQKAWSIDIRKEIARTEELIEKCRNMVLFYQYKIADLDSVIKTTVTKLNVITGIFGS